MKKISTNIITENGDVKKITVFVEDETAAALFQQKFYILARIDN